MFSFLAHVTVRYKFPQFLPTFLTWNTYLISSKHLSTLKWPKERCSYWNNFCSRLFGNTASHLCWFLSSLQYNIFSCSPDQSLTVMGFDVTFPLIAANLLSVSWSVAKVCSSFVRVLSSYTWSLCTTIWSRQVKFLVSSSDPWDFNSKHLQDDFVPL